MFLSNSGVVIYEKINKKIYVLFLYTITWERRDNAMLHEARMSVLYLFSLALGFIRGSKPIHKQKGFCAKDLPAMHTYTYVPYLSMTQNWRNRYHNSAFMHIYGNCICILPTTILNIHKKGEKLKVSVPVLDNKIFGIFAYINRKTQHSTVKTEEET